MEPVLNLKRHAEVSFDQCIICQRKSKDRDLSEATSAGISSLKHATELRRKLRDCEYREAVDRLTTIFNDTSFMPKILYHRLTCYGKYTNKQKIERKLNREEALQNHTSMVMDDAAAALPVLRSQVKKMNWTLCMFCQRVDKDQPKLCNISTLNMSSSIISKAKYVHRVLVRIADVNDLIAAEGCYHPNCLKRFFREAETAETDCQSSDLSVVWLVQELKSHAKQGHLLDLSDVLNRYKELANEINVDVPSSFVSRRGSFKEFLCRFVGDIFDFTVLRDTTPNERTTLLIPRSLSHVPLSKLVNGTGCGGDSDDSDDLDKIQIFRPSGDDFLSMVHVALKLRGDILAHPGFKGVDVSEAAEMASVPSSLQTFIDVLLGGQPHVDDEFDESDLLELDLMKRKRVLSIGQDLVFGVCGPKKAPPKHVGLGLSLHEATRSKQLVDIFHKAGHVIGYRQILQIDTGMAEATLQSMDPSTGAVVPPNMVAGRFVQFSVDNIDINDGTLDGKNTFHATQMAAWQRGPPSGNVLENIEPSKSTKLETPEILDKIFDVNSRLGSAEPQFGDVDPEWFKEEEGRTTIPNIEASDAAFLYSRQSAELRSSWTSYNQAHSQVDPPRTITGYMPIIQAPAHELSTMNTAVVRAVHLAKALGKKYVVMTVDQALYPLLMELKWSNPEYSEMLIPRLGGLHIGMNFLKVLGQHMSDSGLQQIWEESGLLGSNSAGKVMDGKSYAKGMRAHKLTWQALWRLLLPQLIAYLETKDAEMASSLSKAVEEENHDTLITILGSERYHGHLKVFLETKDDDVNLKFWWQYLSMVSVLLKFTRAQRDGQWDLYLDALRAMLPYFQRYDHINYARWGPVYLSEMKQLPEEVEREFRQGNFVVKGSDKLFNQVDPDHSLEWVNGIGKKAGGIVGITKTKSALSRWTLSYNMRACVASQTREMYSIHVDDDFTPNEATLGRKKRDNLDEDNILKVLSRLKVFEPPHCQQLVNIATKDVATLEIQDSLLNAEKLGQKQLNDFVTQRLDGRTKCKKLSDTMHKSNAPTFASLYQTQTDRAKGKAKVVKSNRQIFQRLIAAYQAGRPVNLDRILCHELVDVPISIAEENESLRSGNKAVLLEVLTKNVNCPTDIEIPEDRTSSLVLDGQALVVAFGKPSEAKTFGDYADRFVSHVLKIGLKFDRIDVTFDSYKDTDTSIKDGTRGKRKKKSRPIRRLVENREVPLPSNWNDFMALSENKRDLSAFLSNELIQAATGKTLIVAGGLGLEVKTSNPEIDTSLLRSNHEEADTRVILHCVHSASEHIVVAARDTDIAILLLAHFHEMQCEKLWLKAGTSKAPMYIPIHEVVVTLGLEQPVLETILAFHAITGCDTVSYLLGHSKKTSWDAFLQHHRLLNELGKSETLSEEGVQMAEAFICRVYKVPYDCCDKGRVHLFCKCKAPESLPPTSDAARLHIRRANYQTLLWRQANIPIPALPSPTESGWKDVDGKLKPVLTSLPPVPKACREIVFCGCRKGCATKICSCRKADLPCTSACRCSDGPDCKNLM